MSGRWPACSPPLGSTRGELLLRAASWFGEDAEDAMLQYLALVMHEKRDGARGVYVNLALPGEQAGEAWEGRENPSLLMDRLVYRNFSRDFFDADAWSRELPDTWDVEQDEWRLRNV